MPAHLSPRRGPCPLNTFPKIYVFNGKVIADDDGDTHLPEKFKSSNFTISVHVLHQSLRLNTHHLWKLEKCGYDCQIIHFPYNWYPGNSGSDNFPGYYWIIVHNYRKVSLVVEAFSEITNFPEIACSACKSTEIYFFTATQSSLRVQNHIYCYFYLIISMFYINAVQRRIHQENSFLWIHS